MDELWVAAGTYKPTSITTDRAATFQLVDGVAVYGGFAGTETTRDQRNPATNLTILSGDIDNNDSMLMAVRAIPNQITGTSFLYQNGAQASVSLLAPRFQSKLRTMMPESPVPVLSANLLTVTGNTTNSYHVVTGANNVTLDGFTITAGNANDVFPNDAGGGMYNYASNPTLTNLVITGNAATYGAGMENNVSSPLLTGVTFSNNVASVGGGGMYNYSSSHPTLMNVTFSSNSATNYGGGMVNETDSNPTLTNVTFSSNTTALGGGMYNYLSSPILTTVTFSGNATFQGGGMNNYASSPTLTDVTFTNNSVTDGGGGLVNNAGSSPLLTRVTFSANSGKVGAGMVNNVSSNPTLLNVTFSGNTASNYGGGMANLTSSPILTNVTFNGNSATTGGGGGVVNFSNSNPTLTNVTFANNTAIEYGGGLLNDTSTPILTNVTFSGNSGNWGGGLTNFTSSPQIRNAIFWGNTGANGVQIAQIFNYEVISIPNITDSVIQGGCAVGNTCLNVISTEPKLGTLGNYGGFTQSYPLLYGSSAIDTGEDNVCPATDQRDEMRPQRTHCDMGAYEYSRTINYVKPAASGTGNCTSWGNACVLQTALNPVGSDEIWVAAGTYKPGAGTDRYATFQLHDGLAIYGGFIGTETARDQRNPVVNVSILSGDIDNNDSQKPIILTDILNVTGNTTNSYHVVTGANNATLDGFTITAGYAKQMNNFNGVFVQQGSGMYNYSSSPVLANLTFRGNVSLYGGGIYNEYSHPTLTNVIFSNNNAGYDGAGIYNIYSNPTLTNVTFSNNVGYVGVGMANYGGSSPILTNVTFNNNVGGFGGGMFNRGGSSPTLTNVTFSGNSATERGGGMSNWDSSNPTLTNVTFLGNSASWGGGINNLTSSHPQIRNTIFWGNTATVDGPQIFNYNLGTASLLDGIVQGGCPAGTDCSNIISLDPQFGALGNYGGFTQTLPLLPGSPAIHASSTNCPDTDQRDQARGVSCDFGAFESQGFTLAKTGGDSQSAAIGAAFTNPLTLTITANNGLEPVNGGLVTFTPPASGASANIIGSPATITNGAVSVNATASVTFGSYTVVASTNNATSLDFTLTNLETSNAVTGNATLVGSTTATLNGIVNANGGSSASMFEYGLTDTYGSSLDAVPVSINGSSNTAVSAALTGLTPSTLYHFRVKAISAGGSTMGLDQTFTTLGPNFPPTNILLSITSLLENKPAGTLVGNISATDSNAGETFTFALNAVNGCASTGNASFQVVGAQLKTKAVFDFETRNSYSICLRVTDSQGASFNKSFTITVTNAVDELSVNGGFDLYSGLSKIPSSWTAVGFGTLDGKNNGFKTGQYAVKIANTVVKVKTLTQTLAIPTGAAGQKFTFSYWVKGTTLPVTGLCQGQVMLYSGTVLKLTQTLPCGKTGTFAYIFKTLTFTTSTTYDKAVIKFTFSKVNSSVLYDVVSLKK